MKKLAVSLAAIVAVVGAAAAATYTVKSGDTMAKIANANGMQLATLLDLNPQVKNKNVIFPGQKLNLGGTTVTKTEAAPAKAAPVKVAAVEVATPCTACDNVINGNPLYRPDAGHFYSITDITTDTSFKPFTLTTALGYGITDSLAIWIDTSASTSDSFKEGTFGWNSFGGGLNFRYLNEGNWKGDAYGAVRALGGEDFWHEDMNAYNWTAGTKIGYATCGWTLAGLFEYNYLNSEAFNWGDTGLKIYTAGIEGQYVFNADWNVVAKIVYEMPEWADNGFGGQFGVNYNISKDMYVGAYVAQYMDEKSGELADETTLGLQFGIDF